MKATQVDGVNITNYINRSDAIFRTGYSYYDDESTITITGSVINNVLTNYFENGFYIAAYFKTVYDVYVKSHYRHDVGGTWYEDKAQVGLNTSTKIIDPTLDDLGYVEIVTDSNSIDPDNANKFDVDTSMKLMSKASVLDTQDKRDRNELWSWYYLPSGQTSARLIAMYQYEVTGGATANRYYQVASPYTCVIEPDGQVSLSFVLSDDTDGTYYAIYKLYYKVELAVKDLTDNPTGTGEYGRAKADLSGKINSYFETSFEIVGATTDADSKNNSMFRWVEYNTSIQFTQTAFEDRQYAFKYWNLSYEGEINESVDIVYIISDRDIVVVANFIQMFMIEIKAYPTDTIPDVTSHFDFRIVSGYGYRVPGENKWMCDERTVLEITGGIDVDEARYRFSRITKDVTGNLGGNTVLTGQVGGDTTLGTGIQVNGKVITFTVNGINTGVYVYQYITTYAVGTATSPNGIPSYFGLYQEAQSGLPGSLTNKSGVSNAATGIEDPLLQTNNKYRTNGTFEQFEG